MYSEFDMMNLLHQKVTQLGAGFVVSGSTATLHDWQWTFLDPLPQTVEVDSLRYDDKSKQAYSWQILITKKWRV